MKNYSMQKIFTSADFPLVCSLARQHDSMVPHSHDFVEIILVTRGCTTHVFEESDSKKVEKKLIRGDLFSILPGEIHSYRMSTNFEIYNLALAPSILGSDLDALMTIKGCRTLLAPDQRGHSRKGFYLFPRQRQVIMELFEQMSKNGQPQDMIRRLEQRTLLTRFFLALQRLDTPQHGDLANIDKYNFLAALDRIENHPEANDSLDKLAKLAGMSVSVFTAKFRRELGISVGQYRQILRLDHAVNLLQNTDMSIEEIAIESGFYDSNYFIKIYRRHYGTSPARNRKNISR